ncbi:MAG: mRNA-degrading endonuclease RelE of RelBE toxin-antitoxin system [Alloalcanivorax venustensis]|jgi:mRNA-degrading endonuclease RelE of RelBE toxin-antitoxin system
MYSIDWTKKAIKQLRKIQPEKQRKAILAAVQGLDSCPTNAANVKALKGHEGATVFGSVTIGCCSIWMTVYGSLRFKR